MAGESLVATAHDFAPIPDGADSVGGVVEVEASDGEVSGPVEFRLDLDSRPELDQIRQLITETGVDENPVSPVWLAHYDPDTGWWEPIPTTLQGNTAVATVDHLSIFGWLTPDLGWVTDAVEGMARGLLPDTLFGAEHPQCEREDEVRATLEVSSDNAAGVMWCLGLEGPSPVLKVANNRMYAVAVHLPAGVAVLDAPGRRSIFAEVAVGAEEFSGADVVLARGETASFTAAENASGTVQVVASPVSGLGLILESSVDMYSAFFGIDPAVLEAAIDTDCILANTDELFSNDLTASLSGATEMIFGCVGETVAELGGGWLVGATVALISSLANAVVVGIGGAVNAFADFIGTGGTTYEIVITQATTSAPAQRYVLEGLDFYPEYSETPHFSGCTPGTPDSLPDGIWYGTVEGWNSATLTFDLYCLFGRRVVDGIERGEISNDNPATRSLRWADTATVLGECWIAGDVNAHEVVRVPKDEAISQVESLPRGTVTPERPVQVFIAVNGGQVTELYVSVYNCVS